LTCGCIVIMAGDVMLALFLVSSYPGDVMLAGFLSYVFCAVVCVMFLIVYIAPAHGVNNIFVYIAICSIMGSLSVMSVKVGGFKQCGECRDI
jgi:hypothetical protein